MLWQQPLQAPGLGGVAATRDCVIVSDRELDDRIDAWKCFDTATGAAKWTVRSPAGGMLDYGNSPRATPVIAGDRVLLFGAFGNLLCVNLATGETLWELNTTDEFEPAPLKWGTCATPLVVGERVIMNPGSKAASLAALDLKSGKVQWKSPGKPAGYGSFILATISGHDQVIGHDAVSLGGWNPATGERLWTLVPEKPNDFNVPTPIVHEGRLIICTENNGTRLHDFDDRGQLRPKPVAVNRKLAPDTHTPVVCGGRLFGHWRRLYCLDIAAGLKEVWSDEAAALGKYATLVADAERVLAIGLSGDLVLYDGKADDCRELGRLKAVENESGLYSHAAFVKDRVYLRASAAVLAIELK